MTVMYLFSAVHRKTNKICVQVVISLFNIDTLAKMESFDEMFGGLQKTFQKTFWKAPSLFEGLLETRLSGVPYRRLPKFI